MATEAKAILFDLDGVVIRTDRLHFAAWKSVCDARNWHFDEKINDLLRGVPRLESLRIILRHNAIVLDEASELKVTEEKNALFRESIKTLSAKDVIPGAVEMVKELRKLGAKTAICSSSRNARESVGALGLEGLFDVIVTGKDVVKAKPDPEIFLTGAKLLGVKAEECVVVEDAQAGIDAARAAGMRCVGFGPENSLNGATALIQSFLGLQPGRILAPDAFTH